MQYDLSSKITLERTPERYFRSTDMIENLRQTRYEKLRTNIYADATEGSLSVAQKVAGLIREKETAGKPCILGLSGGFSPLGVYEELVRMHQEEHLSFANVVVFNVSEFFPYNNGEHHSNAKLLRTYLLDKVFFYPDNFYSPDEHVNRSNVYEFCKRYEELIEQHGGLDLVLVSVGLVGNIAYNEPGSQVSTLTRLMLLDNQSQRDLKKFDTSIFFLLSLN